MAPRPGADRLVAVFTKTACARFSLALAVAVTLAVSGCGGGSSDKETASAPDFAAGTTVAEGSRPATSPSTEKQSAGRAASTSEGRDSAPAATADSKPHAGKQGPRIASPKGPPESAPTPAQRAQATVADMALESPALSPAAGAVAPLPATYTCDGRGSWPAFHWQDIPPGTAELTLFAMNVQPVEEKLFFDWAVAGLDPSLEGLEAGRLPKGAVIGQNGFGSNGYEICPPEGSGETYMFALYALPKALSPDKGFDPRELRKEVLATSGNVGLLPASYSRG